MKSLIKYNSKSTAKGWLPAVLFAVVLGAVGAVLPASAGQPKKVAPPGSNPYGKSYSQWAVAFNQWALGLPVAGHPYLDTPDFDVTEGQTGQVWFLAQPGATGVERTCAIPLNTALFISLPNSEWSSLEGYPTKADQRQSAQFFFKHTVNPFCIIDGVSVKNIGDYGVQTPQFTFTAPTPWIFGDTGGTGTSVAKGYFIFLAPLSSGNHTIEFGGGFHFSVAEGDPFDYDVSMDITYHLTVN